MDEPTLAEGFRTALLTRPPGAACPDPLRLERSHLHLLDYPSVAGYVFSRCLTQPVPPGAYYNSGLGEGWSESSRGCENKLIAELKRS